MIVRRTPSKLYDLLAATTVSVVILAGLVSGQTATAETDPNTPVASVPVVDSAGLALAEVKSRLVHDSAVAAPRKLARDAIGLPVVAATNTIHRADFNPGNLISDANFYNGSALSEVEVQAFLDSEVPTCVSDVPCLRDFLQTTTNVAADKDCAAYVGAANESAARIIANVGKACGISQKVLLVLLQKESGLVTDDSPKEVQYAQATGYFCPGTTPCDPTYAGFFRQVYHAAWQFKEYLGSTTFTWFPVGGTSNIAYSDVAGCGSSPVTIWNNATAALYYYTPFQPNESALANFFGYGDACGAYGNRNFWGIYNGWFDSSTNGSVPWVERISGDNRYDTAVSVSQKAYSSGPVPVVYIATGANFPDALGAAAAAASQKGPLLLVAPDSVPASVDAELTRLAPGRIVVVGGVNAIDDTVFGQLQAHQSNITRLAGIDRYDTSRRIAIDAFRSGSQEAYIATGANFPDALSAGAVAGSKHAPVILVDGAAGAVDGITLSLLRDLGVATATIVGGPNAVGSPIEMSLKANVNRVDRVSGATRFETSAMLNRASFASAPTIFLATGYSFPDALAGAAAAGAASSPLYVVPTGCVPSAAVNDVFSMHASSVKLLGGPNALADTVGQLRDCQ